MRFTKSELEMVYKYEATTKEDTVKAMRDGQSAAGDDMTRIIIRNAADKLEKLPEPECSRFIADNKAHFIGQVRSSVLRRLNEAKERLKQPVLQGHDLSGRERFQTDTRHPSDNEKRNIDSHKNSYISDRTARILKKFDYTELPMVDELIADLYVLDDTTRRDLFEYTKMLKKNHTSPERAADLKDIK